jgi:hypothetical protein
VANKPQGQNHRFFFFSSLTAQNLPILISPQDKTNLLAAQWAFEVIQRQGFAY